MTRYVRKNIMQDDQIVDPTLIDDDLNQSMVPFNGGLDSNNFPSSVFLSTKVDDHAFHDIFTHYNPWSGAKFLDTDVINSRGWTFFSAVTFDFTAEDEGVLVGAYSGSVIKYAQTLEQGEMGWAVGVFLDGRMVGRSELTTVGHYMQEVPFAVPVEKGTHQLKFGYRGLSYVTSVSGTHVFNVSPPIVWFQLSKR